MPKPLLTAADVAALLRLHVETVYALIAQQGLPAARVGGRWRFEEAKVREWFAAQYAPRTDGADHPSTMDRDADPPHEDSNRLLGLDITAHRLLESQLVQAQKLEAIGQLAAGIAHEINTPMQYIGDNLCFLQDAFADLAKLLEHYTRLLQATTAGMTTDALVREVEETAEEIDVSDLREEIPNAIARALHGVSRVAEIVRAMKEFSHPGTGDKSAVDLNKAIANTITVARNEWKYVAEVATDYDPALPLVPCFASDVNQVILNMIVNAAHAITDVVGDGSQGKGTITISTRQEGDWAEIRIADTGTGIPEAVRPKIFDPFFTTKAVGKGTGQGLAISHDVVVKKHGGTLTVETAVGQGTTFIIRLPLGTGLEKLGATP